METYKRDANIFFIDRNFRNFERVNIRPVFAIRPWLSRADSVRIFSISVVDFDFVSFSGSGSVLMLF